MIEREDLGSVLEMDRLALMHLEPGCGFGWGCELAGCCEDDWKQHAATIVLLNLFWGW